MNAVTVATIAVGLFLDQHWPGGGQWAVSVLAWIVLAVLLRRSAAHARRALIACLLIATAGEIFLSLVWGVYRYREHNIPLFVPPGHVLLFMLGTRIAEELPSRAVGGIAAAAAAVEGLLAWNGRDTLGPFLLVLFLACLWLSPARRLYATMFVLSLALELYGTWMGNWQWNEAVPWLGLATTNPPVAAGAFYCVLDLLVVSLTSIARKPRVELHRGFDPSSHLQGALVLAVAADNLGAEGQVARAESRGHGDGGKPRLGPE
jgi:hypothetical protein